MAELEQVIANASEELETALTEAALYSGGLVQSFRLSAVATQEQTLAMLKQRLLVARVGLAAAPQSSAALGAAIPTEAAASTVALPDATLSAGDGPFGLAVGLGRDTDEKRSARH